MQPTTSTDPTLSADRASLTHIAVGIDGFPEGEDAAALGAILAGLTGADLMLIAVQPESLILPPVGVSWSVLHEDTARLLHHARAAYAPGARTLLETDVSVPRALRRVVRRHHRDLLVMGSSRQGPDGRVRIGKRTRQLLCHFDCPLAVAPRGLSRQERKRFGRVGVGYDGGPEARAALKLAASIARGADGDLEIDTVVDDRIPALAWSRLTNGEADRQQWEDAVLAEVARVQIDAEQVARTIGAGGRVEMRRGRPADALLELSENVDLLVIGSRRWGPVSRLLLGTTGEAILHDAACPVLVVPRPFA